MFLERLIILVHSEIFPSKCYDKAICFKMRGARDETGSLRLVTVEETRSYFLS
jgi:hypothetical protein